MEPKDVFTCRGVRRAPGFDDAAIAIFGTIQKADEALSGIEFTLGRHPEHGIVAGEDNGVKVWAIKTRPSAIGPAIVLYYWVDSENVHVIRVERAESTDVDDV